MADVFASALALFGVWLFAVAGAGKLRAPQAYREAMSAYMGRPVRSPAVRVVGTAELLLGLLLLVPVAREAAAMGAALLLLIYGLSMARQLARGAAGMRCGCAGPASRTRVAPALVVRNLCLVVGMLWLASAGSHGQPLLGWTLSAACALMLALFYLSADQLIANQQYLEEWD